MWTESTMPIGQSVIVSLLGLTVVFIALIVLALAIMLISKILRTIIKDGTQNSASMFQWVSDSLELCFYCPDSYIRIHILIK